MKNPVIVDAIRTPVGALGGALASVRPDDLAAHVIKTILARNAFDPALVEEVFFGCANQAGEDNRNVARMADREPTLRLGLERGQSSRASHQSGRGRNLHRRRS